MSTSPSIFLWRKLNGPGHDCCQFSETAHGYRLLGVAAFREGRLVCQLRYEVLADSAFHTRRASVSGFVGKTPVDLRIRASNAKWRVGGVVQPALAELLDLDLGFTPATNLLPIRRLSLSVGQEAQAPATYLSLPSMRLKVLPQRYKRISRTEYEYEAPSFGYRGVLVVSQAGAVVHYPGLFEMERSSRRGHAKSGPVKGR